MIILPESFIYVGVPGYFWCYDKKVLYSIKYGYFHKMKLNKFIPRQLTGYIYGPYYKISDKGKYKYLPESKLMKLTPHLLLQYKEGL